MNWKLVFLLYLGVVAANQQYCKCECNGKQLVEKIQKCGLCTTEWCLQKNKNLCSNEELSGNILISCFQIESSKEKFVVCAFVLAVVGLLAGGYWK